MSIKRTGMRQIKKNKVDYPPLNIIVMILNPFIAALISVINAFHTSRPRVPLYCIMFLLAMINITIKAAETDYNWYLPLYKSAIHENFTVYLFLLNDAKEPLYTLINWVVAHLFLGNVQLFSIFSTLFFYVCGIEGVFSLGKYLKISRVYVVTAALFLLLFPYIFANSANLLRQYYATGIMLWAIPEILGGNKRFWIMAIAAVFIHTSSGLLLLLLLMPFLKWTLSYKSLIFYVGIFFILKFLGIIAEKLLELPAMSFMTYALTKASTETTFETEYTIGKLLFSVLIVGLPFIIININPKLRSNKLIMKLINIQFFLLIYIMSNLNQSELCERLNIYLWCMLPFSILICISYFKVSSLLLHWGIICMFCFFIYYILYMTSYTYYCRDNIFINTIIGFINQSKL